jgi:hypothetical protein
VTVNTIAPPPALIISRPAYFAHRYTPRSTTRWMRSNTSSSNSVHVVSRVLMK